VLNDRGWMERCCCELSHMTRLDREVEPSFAARCDSAHVCYVECSPAVRQVRDQVCGSSGQSRPTLSSVYGADCGWLCV